MHQFNIKELPILDDLARLYSAHNYQLALTGGAIRDFFLKFQPKDFDLVSDAPPGKTESILTQWAGNAKRSQNPFGVISCTKQSVKIQVLTFRTPADRYPSYDASLLSGDPLQDQLSCADMTMHTAALELPGHRWRDPYGAESDIRHRILRPPIEPRVVIMSYPPTMLRYAFFAAKLGFTVSADMITAMTELAEAIKADWTWGSVITLGKILALPDPGPAMSILRETSITQYLPDKWQLRLNER